ncbi:MAG TPA: GNAT family N-acetyltransferase [Vicinamibacterales bacterium]|nr:GNAT family N-acetyltransferase [Vicinamibacterales bacterium]
MFATASLAARIERAECSMLRDLADGATRRLSPEARIVAPIGGGVAIFLGHESPANKLAGLGFDTPPTAGELDAVERAFAAQRAPLQVELSSLGDPSVGRLLTGRGYTLIGFENVLGLDLTGTALEDHADPSIAISRAGAEDTRAWMDAVADGFAHPDTFDGPPSHEAFDRDAIERIFADALATPSFERYLARRNGEVAGGASLRLEQGIAQLAGAATLPAHRRHGVQTALLRYRLRASARRGCDVAVVTTQPGSKSTENVQRFGFAILYVRAILVKSAF